MLEFIVLGIIPGTQIQLSPVEVALLWSVIVLLGRMLTSLYRSLRLAEKYEATGAYFMLITKKHRVTRRLKSVSEI